MTKYPLLTLAILKQFGSLIRSTIRRNYPHMWLNISGIAMLVNDLIYLKIIRLKCYTPC